MVEVQLCFLLRLAFSSVFLYSRALCHAHVEILFFGGFWNKRAKI